MYLNRVELKHRAKLSLQGTKPTYLLIGLVLFLVSNASTWVTALFASQPPMAFSSYEQMLEEYKEYMEHVISAIPMEVRLASLAISIFVAVFFFGFQHYCLRVSRGEKDVSIDALASGFHSFWKVLGLNILTWLFTALWTLLLVVPGLIAAYSYRMAPMLMMDHPEWDALTCIRESKKLMRGRKMELFVLDLSFIGWALLGGIVSMLIYVPLLSIWLSPYMQVTEAHFYNGLIGWTGATQETEGFEQPAAPRPEEWWKQ